MPGTVGEALYCKTQVCPQQEIEKSSGQGRKWLIKSLVPIMIPEILISALGRMILSDGSIGSKIHGVSQGHRSHQK